MPPRLPTPSPKWETPLHGLRLSGTLYCRAELSAPWGIAVPELSGVMMFGILTEGSAWLRYGDERRLAEPGSLWVFPRGHCHQLSSGPKTPAVELDKLPVRPLSEHYEVLEYGGGGKRAHITYGIVRFDEAVGAKLAASLPHALHIDAGQAQGWLAQTVELITHEASVPRLGGDTVLTRLADVIVIQAIRTWLADPANNDAGWLAALKDERLSRAITAIHSLPGEDWTVEGLARVAGMSRSVFAERFNRLVGEPAMAYVTWFRMATAQTRLRDTNEPLGPLAESLGYRSEAAFGRTFKRVVGTSPGRWRRGFESP